MQTCAISHDFIILEPATRQALPFLLIFISLIMKIVLLIKSFIEAKLFEINGMKCLLIWKMEKSPSQMLFLLWNWNRLVSQILFIKIHRCLIPILVINLRETVRNFFLFLKSIFLFIPWILRITVLLKACIYEAVANFRDTFLS
jgi:hypothetical protein